MTDTLRVNEVFGPTLRVADDDTPDERCATDNDARPICACGRARAACVRNMARRSG